MLEIYVVRHGKTEFNKKGLIMGQIDSPLLKSSIKESEKIADKIKNIRFDKIFSSPIGRALVTAEIITKKLKKRTKLEISEELKEINYGVLAGKSKREMNTKYPRYHEDPFFINPKGESFCELCKRVNSFVLKQEKKYNKILLVTHAGCIRVIYSFFKQKGLKEVINMRLGHQVVLRCVLDEKKPISAEFIYK